MPFKGGRFVRHSTHLKEGNKEVAATGNNVEEERIEKKVQETKTEIAKSEDEKKERLKRFVSLKIK